MRTKHGKIEHFRIFQYDKKKLHHIDKLPIIYIGIIIGF